MCACNRPLSASNLKDNAPCSDFRRLFFCLDNFALLRSRHAILRGQTPPKTRSPMPRSTIRSPLLHAHFDPIFQRLPSSRYLEILSYETSLSNNSLQSSVFRMIITPGMVCC